MGKIKFNPLVDTIEGTVGNSVLRKVGSRTIVAKRPERKDDGTPPPVNVKRQRDRFRRAAAYANAKIADPVTRAEYEELASKHEFMTAFTMAVRDFLRPPEMEEVSVTGYRGAVGDKIIIKPMDYQKIKTLMVTIARADGTVVEFGNASVTTGEIDWTYTATVANAELAGCKITAVAIDRANNQSVKEVVLL
ncbi:MAG TPA: hypothetical protein VGK59_15070 [Ohtaekwangia sp.]